MKSLIILLGIISPPSLWTIEVYALCYIIRVFYRVLTFGSFPVLMSASNLSLKNLDSFSHSAFETL